VCPKNCLVISAIVTISLVRTDIAQSQIYGLQIDVGQGEVAGVSPVHFVIHDPQGRRTGFDPLTNQWLAEIPGANYGAAGIGDQVNTEYEEDVPFEFITSNNQPPINGTYRIRLVGTEQSTYSLAVGIHRSGTFLPLEARGACQLGSVAYYQFSYNSNPSVAITLETVPPSNQVSCGIFNPSGNSLAIKAKPSVNFQGNSFKTGVITVRWSSSYNISLGTPNSPAFGFAKWDSIITDGPYNYQKFRAVGSIPINWQADEEYELFTTTVSGGSGTGTFELTNAIPGGEWFVDIDYSDKTDSVFYQPIVTGTPLPIQLYYFRGTVLFNNHVRLEWGTMSETNNYGFFVQESRSATSGFVDIPDAFIPGHGTTNQPQSYSYMDENTSSGRWYYRLKQMDLDGTVHYSDPISVYVPETQVDFSAMSASPSRQRQVSLDWSTRREQRNNRFEVQVSRGDSLHFRTIPGGTVRGRGTSNAPHRYEYRDARPAAGIWYYRLKQFDDDGRTRMSQMIRVNVE
jgi:hypothetical protein